MSILSRVWKQQCSVISPEKSCFSVTPKKIRQVKLILLIEYGPKLVAIVLRKSGFNIYQFSSPGAN